MRVDFHGDAGITGLLDRYRRAAYVFGILHLSFDRNAILSGAVADLSRRMIVLSVSKSFLVRSVCWLQSRIHSLRLPVGIILYHYSEHTSDLV